MTEQIRKLKTVYAICLSALTVIVGGLFISQVWSIFFSAEKSPFTYATIGEKFLQIMIPVCLWIIAVIGGGVLSMLYPSEKEKAKGYVSPRLTLERLESRLPANEGGMSLTKRIKTFEIVVWSVAALAIVAGLVAIVSVLLDPAYVPLFNGEFFTSHGGAADRLVRSSVYVGICTVVVLTAIFLDEILVKKKTEIVKQQLAENAKQGIKPSKAEKKRTLYEKLLERYPIFRSKWWKQGLQIGICALGIALFVVGIVNGGMADVFEKARNICTQCIGLG